MCLVGAAQACKSLAICDIGKTRPYKNVILAIAPCEDTNLSVCAFFIPLYKISQSMKGGQHAYPAK